MGIDISEKNYTARITLHPADVWISKEAENKPNKITKFIIELFGFYNISRYKLEVSTLLKHPTLSIGEVGTDKFGNKWSVTYIAKEEFYDGFYKVRFRNVRPLPLPITFNTLFIEMTKDEFIDKISFDPTNLNQ